MTDPVESQPPVRSPANGHSKPSSDTLPNGHSQLEGQWSSILRCSELGLLVVNRDAYVVGFTPAIAACFDLIPEDVGRPIGHLRCKLDNPHVHEQIMSVLEVGNSVCSTVEAPGSRVFLQQIDPHLDDEGGRCGAILTLTEITPFSTMVHGQGSSQSDPELPSFAYAVSHDLQTPLRQIYQQCEMIAEDLKGPGYDSVRELLVGLKASTTKVRGLMESLLEFSRINSEADSFTDVDLNGLFDNVLDQQRDWIDQTGATITRDRLPIVDGDPRQLHKLFSNLIDNALRYRREQAPIIQCHCERHGEFWQVTISDNGRGIDSQDFENVFTIFRRGEGGDAEDQQERERLSTRRGIGLAVARRIASRHGGRIWVASADRNGTTIGLALPVDVG